MPSATKDRKDAQMSRANASGDAAEDRATRPAAESSDAGRLSRLIIEILAASGAEGIRLDKLKRRVAAALDEPLPPAFDEQLEVLLASGYVEHDSPAGAYRLSEQGRWLVQGIEVVHG
jgi:hypothetical protein